MASGAQMWKCVLMFMSMRWMRADPLMKDTIKPKMRLIAFGEFEGSQCN